MFSMPNRHAHCAVLPTKTSLQCIQFSGVSFSFLSAGSHVSSTSFMNLLVLTIFVVVTCSYLFDGKSFVDCVVPSSLMTGLPVFPLLSSMLDPRVVPIFLHQFHEIFVLCNFHCSCFIGGELFVDRAVPSYMCLFSVGTFSCMTLCTLGPMSGVLLLTGGFGGLRSGLGG